MSLEFTTAKRRKEPITFTLDDVEYVFTPPKTANVILDYVETGNDIGALLDWLEDGLSEEQAQLIIQRLKDPDDDLDMDTLGDITAALLEKVVGRPTRRSSGSPRRPSRTGRS
jgi:hypothetical protein